MKQVFNKPIIFLATLAERIGTMRFLTKKRLISRRNDAYMKVGEARMNSVSAPSILVVITHIVRVNIKENAEEFRKKVDRLAKNIDGLMMSFSHCKIRIIINTIKDHEITYALPDYQKKVIELEYSEGYDPTHVGFHAQDIFEQHKTDYDWFLFIEDDIYISDSTFLDKFTKFNEATVVPNALLMPHRFEFYQGVKRYIDMYSVEFTQDNRGRAWKADTQFEADGVVFAEYANPHSGLYLLNQKQLNYFLEGNRDFFNRVSFISPLESAVTGCLMEKFILYKPYYTNTHYLEVEHVDNKYSLRVIDDPGQEPSWLPANAAG